MPRDGNVTAKSGDGSITIEQVRGHLELRTGDGSIHGREIAGQMTFATGDGSVTLEGASGDLDVDTGDGSVSVAGKLNAVKLHTGDGTINFRADEGTAMNADWSMTTGDGSIALYLPSDFAAELDAHTGDGSIRNELKLAAEAEAGDRSEESKRTLRTRLGAGGKTLKYPHRRRIDSTENELATALPQRQRHESLRSSRSRSVSWALCSL